MTSAIVVARQSFTGAIKGEVLEVREGDLFEADHPAVKAWPDNFAEPVLRYPTKKRAAPRTEQATRAPGEKRKR